MHKDGTEDTNVNTMPAGADGPAVKPVPGLDALPVWDRAVMLERVLDDEDLLDMVREGYLMDMPNQIGELKNLIGAGDVPGVTRQAHTIKGASANVCAERMREMGLWMEKAAKDGDIAGVAEKLAQLDQEFELVKKAMAK